MSFGALNDPKRLEALRSTGLLDGPDDPGFDQLARTWARILHVPLAMVSLVDAERHFVKSCTLVLPEPYGSKRELPISHSFCKHVVELGEPLIVSDAREHPLLKDNPAITELGAIAYAGMPLVTPEGHILGTLCFVDTKPREWNLKAGSIVFRPRNQSTSSVPKYDVAVQEQGSPPDKLEPC